MAIRKSSKKSDELELTRVRGRLQLRVVRKGTGSEHKSWVLETQTHGILLLKKLGGPVFGLGPPPAEPGSEIEAEGYLWNDEIRYRSVKSV